MGRLESVIIQEPDVELGEFQPKVTSTTDGQGERLTSLWNDGRVDSGVWEANEGAFASSRIGYVETCLITEGRATIVEEGKPDRELSAGDIFITPSGWKGVWHIHEKIRKHYTIIQDPTAS